MPRLINARSHAVVDLALAARALAEATLIINNNDNSSSRSKNNNSMHSPLLDGNTLHAAAPPRPSPPPLPLHLAAAPRVGWGRVVGHRGMGRDGIPPPHTHPAPSVTTLAQALMSQGNSVWIAQDKRFGCAAAHVGVNLHMAEEVIYA